MKDLVGQAHELQTFLIRQGWDFCFIDGIAIQRWSEPRLTKDMDITLLTGFGGEDRSLIYYSGIMTPGSTGLGSLP